MSYRLIVTHLNVTIFSYKFQVFSRQKGKKCNNPPHFFAMQGFEILQKTIVCFVLAGLKNIFEATRPLLVQYKRNAWSNNANLFLSFKNNLRDGRSNIRQVSDANRVTSGPAATSNKGRATCAPLS